MREERRDQFEIFLQRLREKWIELDENLTGPESRFRGSIIFIRSRPLYLRWITVILSVATFLLIGIPLPGMTVASQLLLFLPSVLISSLYGGSLAGTAAAFLGAALTAYGYFPHLKDSQTNEGMLALLLYFLACAIVICLAHAQDEQRRIARKIALNLEERVLERTRELHEANQEMAGFCYSISHDLRAPLRNIVGSSHILMEDLGKQLGEEGTERLQGMADSANRLSSLVDDLLDYARLSMAELQIERIEISKLFEEVCEKARSHSWKFKRMSVKVQPGLVAGGDRSLISLAIRSIVENSCKYCRPNAILALEFGECRLRGQLWYFIRDNGIGFEMQYAKKIFEPFQRLHRDVEVAGTGIGLANVRRIVERHDGEVFAESVPGEGSTIYFRLGSSLSGSSIEVSGHKVVMADEA